MRTLRAILFDLDNTLLRNDMDTFIPAYLRLISSYASQVYDPNRFIQHMLAATEVMAANTDPAVTNEKAFWDAFSQLTGCDPAEMIPFFTHFYEEQFDSLRRLAQAKAEARSTVEWAFAAGYAVVIATNPMFPRIATEKRLAWAGLSVNEYDYALVTTYENMHATKPHREYYLEILERLRYGAEQVLMVGDDWEHDIEPAAALGIRTYWVDGTTRSHGGVASGQGPLSALESWVEGP